VTVPPRPTFFRSPAEFRRWLKRNHARAPELWVGFHKKGSGRASITWPESVDEALCFAKADPKKSGIHAYARSNAALGAAYEKRFRANKKAWTFFKAQAPWYQRTTAYGVVSTKREETQQRRLATLIGVSETGRRLGLLAPP
jgi:uncharacterized protein YdeI (YjbR/CyaY-like superfamily)